jgi:Protein of unknown function (DUF2971)
VRTLYKYLEPNRTDVLREGRIRFTQPAQFNDPFESRPYLGGLLDSETMERVSKLEAKRLGMPDEMRREIMERSQSPDRKRIVTELMMQILGGAIGPVTSGILSLTEKYDNLLMWAHYAAQHTGYVIEIDMAHEFWKAFDGANVERGPDALRKVAYSEHRPGRGGVGLSVTDVYFTKSVKWAYEQEWRILRNVGDADHTMNIEGKLPIYLYSFPKESVKTILLGCRVSDTLRESVLEIVRTTPEYAKTTVYEGEIDDADFKINFNEIWSAKVSRGTARIGVGRDRE